LELVGIEHVSILLTATYVLTTKFSIFHFVRNPFKAFLCYYYTLSLEGIFVEEPSVEKITRRYQGLNPKETAIKLRESYTRKREAIQKFTDRLEKSGGFVDESEIETLRAVGVSEEEIEALVAQYGEE
jgi:hypothetical protein